MSPLKAEEAGASILVTGASGFIGRHLCRALLAQGATVHALSRDPIAPCTLAGTRWWAVDLLDRPALGEVIARAKPRKVVHLAARVTASPHIDCVLPTLDNNLVGTVNLLRELTGTDCDCILLAGSSEMKTFDADSAVGMSPYAAAKMASSIYANLFSQTYGLPIVTARLFHVFGPEQNEEKFIPYVIRCFLTGIQPRLGQCNRVCDLIYVADAVDALIRMLFRPHPSLSCIDIGTGRGRVLRDVVLSIQGLLGSNIEPIFGTRTGEDGRLPQVADPEPAKNLLDWQARTSLAEGLRKVIMAEELRLFPNDTPCASTEQARPLN